MVTETMKLSSNSRRKLTATEVIKILEETGKELADNQFATYELTVNKYEVLEV